MNTHDKTTTRISLIVLTVLGLWALMAKAQFGSFVHDQPFMAADAGGSTPAFVDPNSISNMIFWLDSFSNLRDAGGDFPIDDEAVVYWGDKSVNNYYFTNYYGNSTWANYQDADASLNPTNGPIVKFSASTTSRLVINTNDAWAQPLTLFYVAWMPVSGAYYSLASTNATVFLFGMSTGSGNFKVFAHAGASLSTAIQVLNTWLIVTCKIDGANSLIRTNGHTYVTGNMGSNPLNGITIGNGPYGQGLDNPNGYGIPDIILYDGELTENEMLQVEQYLSDKYNITNSILHP